LKKDAKAEAIRYWWEKALESLEAARRDRSLSIELVTLSFTP
jgi:hypothetical protein